MRDWQPRSRPTRGSFSVDEPIINPLVPGAAAVGTERMEVHIRDVATSGREWITCRVALTIENIFIGELRPAMFWLGYSDFPTGIVHFPEVAGYANLMFRGRHSVLLRVVQ